MKKFQVTIEGLAPILFNRFTEKSAGDIDSGRTGGKLSIEERKTEALDRLYQNEEGFLCVPAEAIEKSLSGGCGMAQLKQGRRSAVPYVEAYCYISPRLVPFEPLTKDPDGIDEHSGRRPPKTGGRCIIRRPYLNAGWVLTFELTIIKDNFSEDTVYKALEEAGISRGLLDWRPKFGRFHIVDWKEVKCEG